MNFMKQLQEKLLALLLMALLTGTGAYAQEASDKQKTPDYRFAVRTNVLYDAFLLPTLGVEAMVLSVSATLGSCGARVRFGRQKSGGFINSPLSSGEIIPQNG